MGKEDLQQQNNLEKTTADDLHDLQSKAVSSNLENLGTKAKNIMESVGSVFSSFKEKLTNNSKTIVSIIETFKSLKIFDRFFGATNEDGTPNEKNIMLQKWLGDVYTVEYSLDKKPYKQFINDLGKLYDKNTIFTQEIVSDKNNIQQKITDFISLEDNKENFKELYKEGKIQGIIDPGLLSSVLKDNTVGLVATDFFDAEGKILATIDKEKINSLVDLLFQNDQIKKSLQNIAAKNIDTYAVDTTKEKRIKSDADIAYLLFAVLCKPSFTENISLYNQLPSELVKIEIEKKKEDAVVVNTNTTVQIAKPEKENPVVEVQVDEKQEQKEEVSLSTDLINNEMFINSVKEEIFFTESKKNYGAVNPNDGGSSSIGLIQFNWNASNAPELLKKMYAENKEYFDQKLSTSSRYNKFKTYISGGKDRKGAKWTKVDTEGFKDFMQSKSMKDVMDKEVDTYVKRYINECIKKGITNPKMITYLCRLQNFGPKPFQDVVSQLQDKNSFEELKNITLSYMNNKEFIENKGNYTGKTKNYADSYARIDQKTDQSLGVA